MLLAMRFVGSAGLTLAAWLAACSSGDRLCSLIGCSSGAVLRIHTGLFTDGDYSLRLAFDDTEYECPLSDPDALPTRVDWGRELKCTPEIPRAWTGPHIVGETSCDHETCERTLDGYLFELTTPGTPTQIRVSLERDGQVLFERAQSVEYHRIEPNGPGCGPTCTVSDAEFYLE
jgi:hypothetical protein